MTLKRKNIEEFRKKSMTYVRDDGGIFMITSLQIDCWVSQRKTCENLSMFNAVNKKTWCLIFALHPAFWLSHASALRGRSDLNHTGRSSNLWHQSSVQVSMHYKQLTATLIKTNTSLHACIAATRHRSPISRSLSQGHVQRLVCDPAWFKTVFSWLKVNSQSFLRQTAGSIWTFSILTVCFTTILVHSYRHTYAQRSTL